MIFRHLGKNLSSGVKNDQPCFFSCDLVHHFGALENQIWKKTCSTKYKSPAHDLKQDLSLNQNWKNIAQRFQIRPAWFFPTIMMQTTSQKKLVQRFWKRWTRIFRPQRKQEHWEIRNEKNLAQRITNRSLMFFQNINRAWIDVGINLVQRLQIRQTTIFRTSMNRTNPRKKLLQRIENRWALIFSPPSLAKKILLNPPTNQPTNTAPNPPAAMTSPTRAARQHSAEPMHPPQESIK